MANWQDEDPPAEVGELSTNLEPAGRQSHFVDGSGDVGSPSGNETERSSATEHIWEMSKQQGDLFDLSEGVDQMNLELDLRQDLINETVSEFGLQQLQLSAVHEMGLMEENFMSAQQGDMPNSEDVNGMQFSEFDEMGIEENETSELVNETVSEFELQQLLDTVHHMEENLMLTQQGDIPDSEDVDGMQFGEFDEMGIEENETSLRGAPRAATKALGLLPMIPIEQSHLESGSAFCAICMETAPLGELVKQLPCLHLYHNHCLVSWTSHANSCPTCRHELELDHPEDTLEVTSLTLGHQGWSIWFRV